jgi:putative spermidine/putrescine transport system ATP-binding protein
MIAAAGEAAALTLRGLTKRFDDTHLAVSDMNLHVEPGEMIALLGPSGCGKTTTLRMIAGFLTATAGDILLDGESILDVPAHRRDMGIVFQSYALFPHLTVAKNVRFGLEMRRMPAADAARRVAEMLRLVKLDAPRAASRRCCGSSSSTPLPSACRGISPAASSSALRWLARSRSIRACCMLDEPLSNLDAALRQEMAREIRLLQRDGGITAIVVTHDQREAMAMADRLVVMRDGRVEQIGSQEDLYERPATPFVAGFIGQSNLLSGNLDSAGDLLLEGGARIALAGEYNHRGSVCLAIRPESIRLAAPESAKGCVEGTVKLCGYLGAVLEHVVRLDSGRDLIVRGPGLGPEAARRWAPDDRVSLDWSAAAERLFDDLDRSVPATAAGPVSTERGNETWAQTA